MWSLTPPDVEFDTPRCGVLMPLDAASNHTTHPTANPLFTNALPMLSRVPEPFRPINNVALSRFQPLLAFMLLGPTECAEHLLGLVHEPLVYQS